MAATQNCVLTTNGEKKMRNRDINWDEYTEYISKTNFLEKYCSTNYREAEYRGIDLDLKHADIKIDGKIITVPISLTPSEFEVMMETIKIPDPVVIDDSNAIVYQGCLHDFHRFRIKDLTPVRKVSRGVVIYE